MYRNIQYQAQGGILEDQNAVDVDLALQQFYQDYFGTNDPERIKERLFNQALDMFIARQLRVEELGIQFRMPINADQTENALYARLRPEGTVSEYITQISEWVANAYGNSPVGNIIPKLGRYYEALALDELRAFAYGESELNNIDRLNELEFAVLALPRAIFNVDVSFVQDTLLNYVSSLKQLHDLQVQLRAQLAPIELQLTGQEARPFLTWVDELLLSLISDVFDVFFSLREILQGNWLGLLGLLPLIPSSIAHLGHAARYAVNVSEDILARIRALVSRTDEIGAVERGFIDATGARAASDFPVDIANNPYYLVGLSLYDNITDRDFNVMLEALNQRYGEVPIDVFDGVYRHVFEEQHVIFTDQGKVTGYFSPDPTIGYLWMRGIGEETLAQTLVRNAGGHIEEFSMLGNLDFRRLVAHEYIESQLMKIGYEYHSLMAEMRSSAHLLAPGPWVNGRSPFSHYHQLGLNPTEINDLFSRWLDVQTWDFKFTDLDDLVNLITSLATR